MFAIFGVTFLKGTFYQCTFDGIETEGMLNLVTYPRPLGELNSTELSWLDYNKTMCRASSWGEDKKIPTSRDMCDCLVQHSEWGQTIPQNFDNVLKGFALLFEISTTEGWVDVMNAAIDQRGIDMQPVQDNNRIWALFFLIFLVLGSFFMLELFVGVIIENFAKIREVKGHGLMTEAQRQWASTQAFIMKVKPERLIRRPAGKIRSRCYDIVMPGSNPMFDRSIVAVIVANSISISTLSFGDNDAKLRLLGTLNEAFSFIFIVEAILKITAFGTGYFRDKWNRFDFGVVVGLVSGFIVKLTIDDQRLAASISSMVSLIRIGRLVRLVRFIKPLRTPMNTIMRVIPGIANIAALMILLFYVYAVCGVQLYGTIQFQGDLNEQANFRSVGNAMVLLLRFSTGENWNGFMWSLLEERHTCESNPIYDEASPWCLHDEDYPDCADVNGCEAGFSVFVYFYSFTLIVSYVALNMFVGVVLEAFENSQEGDILQPEALDHFVSVWAEFDPDATWYINASDLQRLFTKLRPPLGMGNQIKDNLFTKDQCLLQISVNKNKQVQICDVASHLAKRLAKEKQGEKFGELGIDHPLQQRIQKEMKMTLGEMYMTDAMIVVRAVRRLRQKLAEKKKNEEFPSSTNNNDKDISLLV